MNIFKKLFSKKSDTVQEQKITSEKIDLSKIAQFDDAWVKINDSVFEGWVVEKTNNSINIVYADSNNKLHVESFKLERPLNRTVLEQNNKLLILNKDDV